MRSLLSSFDECLPHLFPVTGKGIIGPAYRVHSHTGIESASVDDTASSAINSDALEDPAKNPYIILRDWVDSTGTFGVSAVEPGSVIAAGRLQGSCFFEPMPAWLSFLNRTARDSFTAEVASSLSQKLKYNRRDAYACLVATPAVPVNFPQAPLGVVELSVQKDSEVLEACGMPEGGEYAYVAGMAVEEEWRRRGVARAMLAACEVLARKWGLSAVVLHVFSDNAPALATYSAAGFELVSEAGGGFLSGRKRALLCKDL